jgi:hypothetical protein
MDVSELKKMYSNNPLLPHAGMLNSLSAAPKPVPKMVWGVMDLDEKLEAAIKYLGERWLLHPNNSPKKGDYDPWGKR